MEGRTRFGEYIFNEHNVCINPEIVEVCEWTNVEVAQCGEHAWVYGYRYDWGGSPCMRDIDVCATRDEAVREGLKRLLKDLEHRKDCREAAKIVREKLFETRQLSLFG